MFDDTRLGPKHKPGPKSKTRKLSTAAETPKRSKRRTPMPKSEIRYGPNGNAEEDGRNLTDKQYLYNLVNAEKGLLYDVIRGEPFTFVKEKTDHHVRPSLTRLKTGL